MKILNSTAVFSLLLASVSQAFVIISPSVQSVRQSHLSVVSEDTVVLEDKTLNEVIDDNDDNRIIRAPLKYNGPYPCIGMRFPNLATQSQRKRLESGVSLDFVLDTAANTNTINGQVAEVLSLEKVGSALPGVGSAGMISGGDTFMLGDAQLEGLGMEPFIFMQNLTASALPIASPAAGGLLSLAFLHTFDGVDFQWGTRSPQDGKYYTEPPAITFYGDENAVKNVTSDLIGVDIKPVPITQLPSVTVVINGKEIPALLDTGSPITVLNSQAAKLANIETVTLPESIDKKKSGNFFSSLTNQFRNAQAIAQLASRGDVLTLAGTSGEPVYLLKSTSKAEIALRGEDNNDDGNHKNVEFQPKNIYVGEIPGLAALNGLGVDSPPAVVLGMDVLRSRPRMFLRAQQNKVYF